MTAIAAAIDVLFADPNIGRDAIWRAGGGGAGIGVRIVFRAPDAITNFGNGRFVTQSRFLDVRISEIATLEAGDTFEIDAVVYVVQGDPLRDDDGVIWQVEVRPQ